MKIRGKKFFFVKSWCFCVSVAKSAQSVAILFIFLIRGYT